MNLILTSFIALNSSKASCKGLDKIVYLVLAMEISMKTISKSDMRGSDKGGIVKLQLGKSLV